MDIKLRSELDQMDIVELKKLYLHVSQVMHDQLLAGVPWEELDTQRGYINAIGVVMDIKSNNFSTQR